jgi:hypothetical protein
MQTIHVCDAQLSFACKAIIYNIKLIAVALGGERGMSSLLKSTVLGLALLGGVAATAHAQSVSALPPTGPATAPSAAAVPAYSSSRMNPDPGGSVNWQAQHSQPTASVKMSPDPGGSVNWQQEHTATGSDNSAASAPYSATHFGPAPN